MAEIKNNLVYLTDNICNLSKIILHLMQEDILSENESNEIESEKTPLLRNKEMLRLIQGKDWKNNKRKFLEILRQTKNEHCADKIEETAAALLEVTTLEELFAKQMRTPRRIKRNGSAEIASLKLLEYIKSNKSLRLEDVNPIGATATLTEEQIVHCLLHFYLRLGRTEDAKKILKENATINQAIKMLSLSDLPNYRFSVTFDKATLELDKETKEMWLNDYSLDISLLPPSLEILTLHRTHVSVSGGIELPNLKYLHLNEIKSSSLSHFQSRQLNEIVVGYSSVDISLLPPSIEKLTLREAQEFTCGEIDLPKLKVLTLHGMSSSCLSLFQSAPILTNIMFYWVEEVDVDLLPPSVTIIEIHNAVYDNRKVMGGVRKVDTLILDEVPLDTVEEFLTHFHPKQLFMYNSFLYPTELIPLINREIETTSVGRVNWEVHSFNESILSQYVDKQSEYYLLQGGRGKAVEWKEMKSLKESVLSI